MIEISGIAHLQLTVNDLHRCMEFYERLLPFLGMRVVARSPKGVYCIGGKTAIAITRSAPEHRGTAFDQQRAGLHHLCFRARSREDVDRVYEFLRDHDAHIVHEPEEGPWFPGYYSLLFEDPDGIRLEINHVPGHGYLGVNESKLPLERMPGFDDYPAA